MATDEAFQGDAGPGDDAFGMEVRFVGLSAFRHPVHRPLGDRAEVERVLAPRPGARPFP